MSRLTVKARELGASGGVCGGSSDGSPNTLVRLDKVRAARSGIQNGAPRFELEGLVADVVAARMAAAMDICECGQPLQTSPDGLRKFCSSRICQNEFDARTGKLII